MKFTSRRLKFCVRRPIVNGVGAAADHDDPSWPRYVRITDIAGPRSLRDETFMSLPPEQAVQAPFEVGDILAAAVGATFGKTYLHLRDIGPVAFAGYLVRISPDDEFDSGFVSYWTESQHYWDQVNTSVVQSTIQNFSAAKYAELRLPSPALRVQRAIVRFLDHETARVDALIAAKLRVLDLLAEKRKAIIATAVTRGLDPKVKLRDSGVPWLGEIPAHWEVRRVRTLSEFITSGPRGWSERISDEGSLFIQSGDLNDVLQVEFGTAKRVRVDDDAEAARTRLQDGDIVVCITGAKTGNVAVCASVPEPAYVNQHLCLVRPNRAVLPLFLGAALKSTVGQAQLALSQYGLKQGLNLENVREVLIALPALDEQRAVVAHIARETAKIDAVRAATERTIALLKERRSALIAAAVTGQLDLTTEGGAAA